MCSNLCIYLDIYGLSHRIILRRAAEPATIIVSRRHDRHVMYLAIIMVVEVCFFFYAMLCLHESV